MKLGVVAVAAALSTFAAGTAHAQWADLNGQYRCVENCLGPGFAFITMQGWDMNLVNEAGLPSRACGTALVLCAAAGILTAFCGLETPDCQKMAFVLFTTYIFS